MKNTEELGTCFRCKKVAKLKQIKFSNLQNLFGEIFDNVAAFPYYTGRYLCEECVQGMKEKGDPINWKGIPILFWKVARYIDGDRLFIAGKNKDGEEVVRITTNLPHEECDTRLGEIFIKNWSENEGLYEYLHSRALVGSANYWARAGYTQSPRVILTQRFKRLLGIDSLFLSGRKESIKATLIIKDPEEYE